MALIQGQLFFLSLTVQQILSQVPHYCASWNSHTIKNKKTFLAEKPVCQLKLLFGFSLHPKQSLSVVAKIVLGRSDCALVSAKLVVAFPLLYQSLSTNKMFATHLNKTPEIGPMWQQLKWSHFNALKHLGPSFPVRGTQPRHLHPLDHNLLSHRNQVQYSMRYNIDILHLNSVPSMEIHTKSLAQRQPRHATCVIKCYVIQYVPAWV